jgi:hypothetical protein
LWQVCYAIKFTFAIANKHFLFYTSFHYLDKRLFLKSAFGYLSTLYVSSYRVKNIQLNLFFLIFMTACSTTPTFNSVENSFAIKNYPSATAPVSILLASGAGLLALKSE